MAFVGHSQVRHFPAVYRPAGGAVPLAGVLIASALIGTAVLGGLFTGLLGTFPLWIWIAVCLAEVGLALFIAGALFASSASTHP